LNKITAAGRVGSDAELRYTAGEQPQAVLSFRVASDIGFGQHKVTNWFNCSVWGKRGESLKEYIVKGDPITVFGSLTLRVWKNKDGIDQTSADIRVDEVALQGGKKADSSSVPVQKAPNSSSSQTYKHIDVRTGEEFEDEIPFN